MMHLHAIELIMKMILIQKIGNHYQIKKLIK